VDTGSRKWDSKGKNEKNGSVPDLDNSVIREGAFDMARKLRVEYAGAIYHVMIAETIRNRLKD